MIPKNTQFEEKIGYHFNNSKLLEDALTHSSFSRERGLSKIQSNERLEFLGDAFFDAIVGEYLYFHLPEAEEGVLSKLRAFVVCEKSLAEKGKQLNVGEYMQFGKSEEKTGGRKKTSLIADAMEAVIGAVYIDGGYAAASDLVIDLFSDIIEMAVSGKFFKDNKSSLQELVQKMENCSIEYVLEGEIGPDHDKTFFSKVMINGKTVGHGEGKSKKIAEQMAAKEALDELRRNQCI